MTPSPDPGEPTPAQMRVSDADRHEVAEILREAAGEGRIDFEELDERLERTYAARTYGDLAPITRDIPAVRLPAPLDAAASPAPTGPRPPRAPAPTGTATPERHVMVMGGIERKGRWTMPERMQVSCVMGGADLDLREATYAASEVVITVNVVMGGASITVGPGVEVVMEGVGIMGGFSGPRHGDDGPTTQILRVRGFAFWGGVSVQRKD